MSNSTPNLRRLAIVSHVFPFPGTSGQQQRVAQMLAAAKASFHLTFIGFAPQEEHPQIREAMQELCDDLFLLPSCYPQEGWRKFVKNLTGAVYCLRTGLKHSNYVIGEHELHPHRLDALHGLAFDGVIYEYWHAYRSLPVFQEKNIPCILDTIDILWKARLAALKRVRWLPPRLREFYGRLYRNQEEAVWRRFDGLIGINQEERDYLQQHSPSTHPVFYVPMGIDLERWHFGRNTARPPRFAFYGGLGSKVNQAAAKVCYQHVMPLVWEQFPDAELWLVGSNPPASWSELQQNKRIVVTGYVPDVAEVLRTMTAILCPWSGTFGFRSRLIETMALGIPVIANPDAVHGMNLTENQGLLLGKTDCELASHALRLTQDTAFLAEQSQQAREQVEQKYSVEVTYQVFVHELEDWLQRRHLLTARQSMDRIWE